MQNNVLDYLDESLARVPEKIAYADDEVELSFSDEVPRMLTIREAAREVGLSYNYIRSLCQCGRIVSIRVGNRTLVNREKLIAFLNSGREEKS